MKIQKKHLQIIVILVVGIWVACISSVVSATYIKKKQQSAPALTTIPFTDQTTFAPATTNPFPTTKPTTEKTTKAEKTTEKQEKKETTTTSASFELKIPQGKEDIIEAYVTAINKLKGTDNFNLAIMESLEVGIDEITGGSTAKSLVQRLIDQNSNKTPQNYKFVNGMDSKGKSPDAVIAPRNTIANLSASDVVSATSKKMSNTAYKVTINLGKQMQTLASQAPGYSTIVNTLDVETLDLPSSISITDMDVTYDNSFIEATIDKDGRILSMKHYVEVPTADIQGKITLASVTLKIHGNFTSSYTITY